MARNILQDLIALADGARAAQELVDRKSSVEQACREAEGRLASLRDEESKAGASIARANREAADLVAQAKARAEQVVAKANTEATSVWSEVDARCSRTEAESKVKLKDLEKKIYAKNDLLADLERQEAAVGQSVAALRADLEAIKAKLG